MHQFGVMLQTVCIIGIMWLFDKLRTVQHLAAQTLPQRLIAAA